jgi:SAM-dependent methyltransferase
MENWIQEQAARSTSSFDAAMISANPEASRYALDPERYFERVCVECNYLDAVKMLAWEKLLPAGARVLDLAGGTGWLTAWLSTLPDVAQVTIVDASGKYLEQNLPVAVRRLGGNPSKIRAVVGFFTPLLQDDASLDVVVASSAIHHAENLEAVLREIHRVLKPGGRCVILNETPVSQALYLRTMVVTFARSMLATVRRSYGASAPAISASGILYDPLLGDRMYPFWYWHAAIERAGFRLEQRVDTGLPTVKDADGIPLTHFVCGKLA